jgi:hypothetical protein
MLYRKLSAQKKTGVELEICHGYPHFFWMLPMLQKSQYLLDLWAYKIQVME